MPPLRWLHLSDFHTGRDNYGERQLFRYVLAHLDGQIAKRGAPDFVFITGDIAETGQKTQYERFGEAFLLPLMERVSEDRIFMVPGNHDVDRTQAKFVTREAIRQRSPAFFDPTEEGLAERQAILPRLEAYRECAGLLDKDDWLASEAACFTRLIPWNGIEIGLLGLNTAWFSEDEHDGGQLTPGKALVETGLEVIADTDVRIVLGHHPLNGFHPADAVPLRALFGQHQILYLHGHPQRHEAGFEMGAGHPFLPPQSGAAFEAREDKRCVNWLVAASRAETSPDEGAFLGALLRLRLGDAFKDHVRKPLDRLRGQAILPDNPNTLLNALAYVAAMAAHRQREADLQDWVPPAEALTFQGIETLLHSAMGA